MARAAQDYETAASTLRLLASDLRADKAWRHYAAAQARRRPPPALVTRMLPRAHCFCCIRQAGCCSACVFAKICAPLPSRCRASLKTYRTDSPRLSQTGGPALTLAASWVWQDCAEAGTHAGEKEKK